ncbi:hypothetical protein NAPIS_ORF02690 [Vairimorpha apis BRL 01]|uniref:Uncharacterized protein n=1 Tax=Vairimorpha apis BRL 01 TaxID=1037528 RepID=T0M8K4_9MICR|nr:hypothetical protein NAPIS_ORF02690 [Vairimorpha apis BRL 01]
MRIEKAINTNYNRSIKASPLSIIRKYNLYDPFNTKIEFKYPFKENKINYVKVGDYCREKLYGAKKLEPKYSGYKEVVMELDSYQKFENVRRVVCGIGVNIFISIVVNSHVV